MGEKVLDFLAFSFEGGTDLDGPLVRSIELLKEAEWSLSDILVVTDGEVRLTPPVIKDVDVLKERLKLKVHGLLLGIPGNRGDKTQAAEKLEKEKTAMEELCTDVHLFD